MLTGLPRKIFNNCFLQFIHQKLKKICVFSEEIIKTMPRDKTYEITLASSSQKVSLVFQTVKAQTFLLSYYGLNLARGLNFGFSK